jgi:hypothetical protein
MHNEHLIIINSNKKTGNIASIGVSFPPIINYGLHFMEMKTPLRQEWIVVYGNENPAETKKEKRYKS